MTTINERLARIERPRSTAATWCYRLALFCVPYMAIVVLGHRTGIMETRPTFWALGVGVAILLAALALGAKGFHDLWTFGKKAGLSSAKGMFIAGLLIIPFAYGGVKALVLPPLHDISTDLEDPLQYDTVVDVRTDEMNSVEVPGAEQRLLQLQAYPRVAARRYPLGEVRVFKEIVELISERDWTVLTANSEPGQAPIDSEGSGLVAQPVATSAGIPLRPALPSYRPTSRRTEQAGTSQVEAQQVAPTGRETDADALQSERYLEAVATSFLFGFPSDVVFRLIEEEDGTLVDMRSSSRWGPHDLGANAALIEEFMGALDLALQGLAEGT